MENNEYVKIVNRYSNEIYKIIFCMIQSKEDTGRIIQDVFRKVYVNKKEFSDDESLHRWLIRTAINETKPSWDASLFPQYRIVFHLYYYENYSTKEIASILHILDTVAKKRLVKAREILKIESDEGFVERGYINEQC